MNETSVDLPNDGLSVPALVRQRVEHLGAVGSEWLQTLPRLVAELEESWSIHIGHAVSGGSAAFVAPVVTSRGELATLKIALPGSGFDEQVTVLEDARGRGYARLFAQDVTRQAMLLERLGPQMDHVGRTPEDQIRALCETLQQAWQLQPREPATEEDARWKSQSLQEMVERLAGTLEHSCSDRVLDQAVKFAKRRTSAARADRCVVVHGDPHPANALRVLAPRPGAESGYVFVDPDGFCADPAYDLGVVLRDWCQVLLAGDGYVEARRLCALLASETGVDEEAIWEWGFLERVSTGLYVLEFGAEEMSEPFLATAELLVDR